MGSETKVKSRFWEGTVETVGSFLRFASREERALQPVEEPMNDAVFQPAPAEAKHPLEIPPVDVTEMALNPHRIELPVDFPKTFPLWHEPSDVLQAIDRALRKHGTSIHEVKKINLAYPHKDPSLYPGHYDNARNTVRDFKERMAGTLPAMQWYEVDELVETVRLGRSEDQSSVHALTARQVYKVANDPQKEPFRFKNEQTGDGEFFLVLDGCVEQGTTLANFISHIALQGGRVLGAVTGNEQKLVQSNVSTPHEREVVDEAFRDPKRNTGRLAQLAQVFSKSAKKDKLDLTPAKCLEIFEGRLNLFGNTVFALTDGECQRVSHTLQGSHYGLNETFKSMIARLDEKLAEYAASDAGKSFLRAQKSGPRAPGG